MTDPKTAGIQRKLVIAQKDAETYCDRMNRVYDERDAAVARAEKAEETLALCENLARRLAQGAEAVTTDDFLAVLRREP